MNHDTDQKNRRWLNSVTHHHWLTREGLALFEFHRQARLASGGFAVLDGDGRIPDGASADTMLTARMAHSCALAALQGLPGAAALAEHAIRALSGKLRDEHHGGWFGADPATSDDRTKQCYTHHFVALGAATATHADIPGAAALLEEAIGVIDTRFWSMDEQAFVESFSQDWSELSDYRGGNSNMHGVELCLALADVRDEPLWLDRALAIAERLIHHHAASRDYRILEHFHGDWSEWPEHNADRPDDGFYPYGATPGHGFEWSRLMLHLEAALESRGRAAPSWLFADAAALFDASLRDGWATDGTPGLVYTVDWEGRPNSLRRRHWTHAEALAAAAAFLQRTDQAHYERWYRRLWDFIDTTFIDRARGGWYQELDGKLQIDTAEGDIKPDLYHAYQATLIPRLPLALNLALAVERL
ncbi:AGE family epimerase/isomerase [Vreelandella titanicae]|uniref:AGE family epimerase/isomerase n=1 Tax=Vreelandella titanicae TaxID=664683 RepID=UPI001F40121C|nr:AGE family epimerase/isomerase [Halomonas titanicae]MCE7516793.1 AGE family epimerase/isomerase [Halomonas titanicae]